MMAIIGVGRHDVQVAGHQLGRSSSGTPYVAVQFEDAAGDRITWYGYLTDAAMPNTLRSLAALGWDATEHDGRVDSLHGTPLLVGAEAEVVVEAEEWEGTVRHKVRWVNERGGPEPELLPIADARKIADQVRTRVLGPEAAPTKSGGRNELPF